MATVIAPSKRLASLDQFRGYTVAGMFLVNYLGHYFKATPSILQHHNTFCSYADTIMPQFFFAVGFSFRLSFGRRVIQDGIGKASWHVVKRLVGLALIAIFVSYQGSPPLSKSDFNWEALKHLGIWHTFWPGALKHTWFQTLTHIAVTSLWILPVIRLRPTWRVLYMVVSALLHLWLSYLFNFDWVNGVPKAINGPGGIDGGPLGFLTWTIPTMMGTLACDMVMNAGSRGGAIGRLLGWGVLMMGLGWMASCGTRWYDVPSATPPLAGDPRFSQDPVFPLRADIDRWVSDLKARDWSKVFAEPPFVPPPGGEKSFELRRWNYWMMSQQSGTISYLTFGAGLSLAIYALFYILSDLGGFKIGVFRTFGTNALIGYILHGVVAGAVKKFVPGDVPTAVMWLSFAAFFYVTWLFIRGLEKQNIYVKL